MSTGPLYPNQQLRCVSLEAYFPGRFNAVSNFGAVQDEFSTRFPQLFVPNAQVGEAPTLRPYQLRDEAQKVSLALAINQATYISFDYPGFTAFSNEAFEVLDKTLTLLGISELSRVVYRYENEVGISRDGAGILPVNEIIQLETGSWLRSDSLMSVDIACEHAWPERSGATRVHLRAEPPNEPDVLRLSIAATVAPCGRAEKLREFGALAHEHAAGMFEAMVTSGFRDFIKQERIS